MRTCEVGALTARGGPRGWRLVGRWCGVVWVLVVASKPSLDPCATCRMTVGDAHGRYVCDHLKPLKWCRVFVFESLVLILGALDSPKRHKTAW